MHTYEFNALRQTWRTAEIHYVTFIWGQAILDKVSKQSNRYTESQIIQHVTSPHYSQ